MLCDAYSWERGSSINRQQHCFRAVGRLVFITIMLAAGCRKASLNGEYRVEFRWENGALKSGSVALANRPGAVPKFDQEEVTRLSEPFIRDTVRKANLDAAAGVLHLVILGEPPYFVENRKLEIRQPDFQDLSGAVQLQDVERIRQLVAEHHNVNQRELPSLQTAVAIAAAGGYVRSLGMLLDLGADPNMSDYIGVTPLMAAVTAGNEDCVRILVAASANVGAVNKAGDSAISLAKELHHEYLLPLLLHPWRNRR